MKYKLRFNTDYHQFFLVDKNSPQNTGSLEFWTDQAFADKLAVEDGVLGIAIENEDSTVDCELEILNDKPVNSDFSNFDHVVEASIKIESGKLLVIDCPFSEIEAEIEIPSGDYRVRVCFSNLNTLFDKDPKDFYNIEVWQEKYSERIVLKRFHA